MDNEDDNGVPPECERTPFWVSLGPGSGFRVATRDDLREAGWVTRGEMDESMTRPARSCGKRRPSPGAFRRCSGSATTHTETEDRMAENPCPVCEIPMHPTMERDYGGCSVDHGEIAELRTEVARLRAGLQEVVDRERVWDALDIRHHVTAILSV